MKYLLVLLLLFYLLPARQRHDSIKVLTFNLDDKIVAWGLIEDETLHRYGHALGVSGLKPGSFEK